MQPERQKPSQVSSSTSSTEQRARTHSRTKSSFKTKTAVEANRNIVLLISTLLFLLTGYAIFSNNVDTLIKQIYCLFAFSFSMGGFFSLFTGSAKVTLGRLGVFTGSIAVALIILILILSSAGLIKIDVGKAIQMAAIAKDLAFLA